MTRTYYVAIQPTIDGLPLECDHEHTHVIHAQMCAEKCGAGFVVMAVDASRNLPMTFRPLRGKEAWQ